MIEDVLGFESLATKYILIIMLAILVFCPSYAAIDLVFRPSLFNRPSSQEVLLSNTKQNPL